LANNVSATLTEFPSLRINEVLARNSTGLRDASGTAEPWIELVNTGTNFVSLDGLFLSDSDANPTRWPFPTGLSIPAGGFMTVFADGEPAQSTLTELHTSFRLASTAGISIRLAIARIENGSPHNVDYFHSVVGPTVNVSSGRLPDGFVASLSDLTPTPGASNAGLVANRPPVFGIIAEQRITEGVAWTLDLTATDPDLPPQTLRFTLIQGPSTLTLSEAGRITWTPAAADVGSLTVMATVTDSGSPPLSTTNNIPVVVSAAPPMERPQFDAPSLDPDGRVRLVIRGVTGRRYRIDSSPGLGPWSPLSEWTADPAGLILLTLPEPGAPTRFYRAVLLP